VWRGISWGPFVVALGLVVTVGACGTGSNSVSGTARTAPVTASSTPSSRVPMTTVTTVRPPTTPTGPSTTATGVTTPGAVVSANGVTMTVSSTPRAGRLGSTTINAIVNLTGAVPGGTLDFLLGIGPANQGQPGSDQHLTVTGPGTYHMPNGYAPTQGGAWALTVNLWNRQGVTILTATGMAATATSKSPYPLLVTLVS
jgi:hypothetical protein